LVLYVTIQGRLQKIGSVKEALKSVSAKYVNKVSKTICIKVQKCRCFGSWCLFYHNNIPSAFELSVTVFEVMYMIYPYTFGLALKKMGAVEDISNDDD
jgi:hypothetical protein